MRTILVHLGYPKAGTTLLQRIVFPAFGAAAGNKVIGVSPDGFRGTPMEYLRFRRTLSGQRPDWYRPRVRWDALVSDDWNQLVISDEGPLASELRRVARGQDSERFIHALGTLRDLIPAAAHIELLLTTRAQGQLVPSLLAEVHHSLPPRARDAEGWAARAADPASRFHSMLNPMRLLAAMTAALNPVKTHVLPLELLDVDPPEYTRRLSEALGGWRVDLPRTRANARRETGESWSTSTADRGGALRRGTFRVYAASSLPLPPRTLTDRFLPSDVPKSSNGVVRITLAHRDQARLTRSFAEANRHLLSGHGLDATRLGYA